VVRARFAREDADYRRQSLIDAAATCLAKNGVAGTSVRAICKEAGVSAGLLTHYFEGIGDLVTATYRDLGERVGKAIEQAVAAAGDDPRARLEAYVTANFHSPVLDPELLATWLAFWILVKTDPAIAAVHGEIYAEFRHGVEALLRKCWDDEAAEDEVRLSAIAISALVDGLWLELCLDKRSFSAAEASGLAHRWLDSLLERHPARTSSRA